MIQEARQAAKEQHVAPHRTPAEPKRSAEFAIDEDFEELLARANTAWHSLEAELISTPEVPSHPLVILCFAPRSGSTLLAQLMARTRAFGYVTNFMARFWKAPYLAGLIERRLDLRGQPFRARIESEYGVTPEPHEPHEFGFFWNRWLTFEGETHRINPAAMEDASREGLRRELQAMMSLFQRPFFLKTDLMGLNPAFYAALFEDVRFVRLHRTGR